VFRVRAPQAARVEHPIAAPPLAQPAAAPQEGVAPLAPPAPQPSTAPEPEPQIDRERLVLVADPDVESGKRVMSALASWGLQPVLVHDGVEALLTIQRMLPRAVILDAALPKMYGFQICEMVKRNESLRSMQVLLVGSVHHQDRYRRPPTEMYGADVYLEKPELLDALAPVLQRFGYPLSDDAAAASPPLAAPEPQTVAAPEPEPPVPPVVQPSAAPSQAVSPKPVEPVQAPPEAAPATGPPQPPVAAPASAASPEDDALAEQRANAERLARIIVSDILLYHPEQFEAGMESGQLGDALEAAIAEGRGFFAQRVDSQVRDERDFILEELQRVVRERRAQ
jgi:CheY-like chemotaxis protein